MKKNIKKIIYIESKPSFLDQHSIINEDLLQLNNEFYYLKKKISSTGIIYNVLDGLHKFPQTTASAGQKINKIKNKYHP
jgi:hypothetical protein